MSNEQNSGGGIYSGGTGIQGGGSVSAGAGGGSVYQTSRCDPRDAQLLALFRMSDDRGKELLLQIAGIHAATQKEANNANRRLRSQENAGVLRLRTRASELHHD